jgi:hypothetical protein
MTTTLLHTGRRVKFHYKLSRIKFLEGYVGEVPTNEALRLSRRGSFGTVANAIWNPMQSIFIYLCLDFQFSSFLLIAERRL